MTIISINMNGDTGLRRIRSWAVVLLMMASLVGGYRTANWVTEETSAEQTSEVFEYAHRLVEGCQRSSGRGYASRLERVSIEPRVSGDAAPCGPAHDPAGAVSSSGHLLSNGLCAPQRC